VIGRERRGRARVEALDEEGVEPLALHLSLLNVADDGPHVGCYAYLGEQASDATADRFLAAVEKTLKLVA
jgi:hypothetical protein